jgi:hypothetical protein
MSPLPRHVVCVLGNWPSFEPVERVVRDATGGRFQLDREYSMLAPDNRMPRAFAASADTVDLSITEVDEAAIASHTAVAYIMSPAMPAEQAIATSATALAMIDALFAADVAVAVKDESAGIAHGAARWRELATRATSSELLPRASALMHAFVRRPLGSDTGGLLYSCGMHLLGDRDIEVSASEDVFDDIGWIDLVALYLLAEKPDTGVHDGEGFRQTEGGERRVLRGYPCERYESDDFFWNPYGYWRLE